MAEHILNINKQGFELKISDQDNQVNSRLIIDDQGNSNFDLPKELVITVGENIQISVKDTKLAIKENQIDLTIAKNHVQLTDKSLNCKIGQSNLFINNSNIKLDSNNIELNAQNLSLNAKQQALLKSNIKTSIEGSMLNLKGNAMAQLTASMITIG